MEFQHKRLRSQATAATLACMMLFVGTLSVFHQVIGATSVADAARPSVILNAYAPPNEEDDAMPATPLADSAVFIAAALPGPCSAEPPCFDRVAVMAEFNRVGGGPSECYQMTNLEQAGSYVSGRIDLQSATPASAPCA